MAEEKPTYTWDILLDESRPSWLEVRDPEGWRSAVVKFDGCIHYYRYFNTPQGMDPKQDEERNYLHICDIDEEIARLQALKATAQRWFAEHATGVHAWDGSLWEENKRLQEQRQEGRGFRDILAAVEPFRDKPQGMQALPADVQRILLSGPDATVSEDKEDC